MKNTICTVVMFALPAVALADVPGDRQDQLRGGEKDGGNDRSGSSTPTRTSSPPSQDTLKAVTGDRGSTAAPLKDLAIGNGFSVSAVPSFDSILKEGVPNFGSMSGDIAKAATVFINGLQLVKSLSGKENSSFLRRQVL